MIYFKIVFGKYAFLIKKTKHDFYVTPCLIAHDCDYCAGIDVRFLFFELNFRLAK